MTLSIMPEYVTSTGVTVPEDLTEEYDAVSHGPLVEGEQYTELSMLEADEDKGSMFWTLAPFVALALGFWWLKRQENNW